jgi:undecaprenyl-diphosphatase
MPSMTFLDALILGIVEGISEFLPISSTGHLVLASRLLGIPETDFVKSFEIVIQFGAILAALFLYWRLFLRDPRTLAKTIVAFVPTGIAGLLLYKTIKALLGSPAVVVWSLFIGGVLLIILEKVHRAPSEDARGVEGISFAQALGLGVCQILSMVPGVSRSASTIMPGLLMGISRKTIVEFSFLLAAPTMAAATGYEMLKNYKSFSFGQIDILAVGFIVSFVTAFAAIKGLLRFIQTHTFVAFGVYRIVAAIAFWLLVLR